MILGLSINYSILLLVVLLITVITIYIINNKTLRPSNTR